MHDQDFPSAEGGSNENPIAPSSAPARTAQPADGGRVGAKQDTTPSNTVSNNSNPEYFKLLRFGIDSLYLSYPGQIHPEIDTSLKALKLQAQSSDPVEQAKAQCPMVGHLFEVKDKAPKGFAYVLEDGAFRIQLSRSVKLPSAYVKISSAYLAHVGPEEAERVLTAELLPDLIEIRESPNVSRIDMYADFVWSGTKEWDREAWVTRASGIDAYSENTIFTGWVVGRGAAISARLYYKLLQAAKIGANYLIELWQQAGWQANEQVWRLEFQLRREVLKQLKVGKLPEVLANLNGLWSYATTDWLKLTLPNPEDKTRCRWPVHPLWAYLSSIDWETSGGNLTRTFDPARIPGDDKLLGMALSVLVSYMAREGIDDPYKGHEALMAALYAHHNRIAEKLGLTFDNYLDQKLGVKSRLFNTLRNPQEWGLKPDSRTTAEKALEYKRRKDGE